MVKEGTLIKIGSLVGTTIGIFGVISKFNSKDNLYTISWAGGLRKGEDVSYDKKMVDHLLKQGDWLLHYIPSEEAC